MRLDRFALCWLEVRCRCGRIVFEPLLLLADRIGGGARLGEVLPHLRCEACGGAPSVMALVQWADGHGHTPGRPPVGWRIVLAGA